MRIIILCCIIFMIGCRKMYVEPTPPKNENIFSVKEATISNGDIIKFDLKTEGIYTLILFDSVDQQVITREKIIGRLGQNNLNIYTKSLPVRYLYLSLEDVNNVQIGKTLLIIK